jgi:hypothetical protein
MTLRVALALVFVLVVQLAGCGTARSLGGDAFVSDNDGGVDPGTDAATSDVDAYTGPTGDPLNAAPTCTSGRTWRLGNAGSAAMNPGLACIDCHSTQRRAPFFSAAGTVYPTGHEPDLCNGTNFGTQVTIELHDASGNSATISPNAAGNFYYQGTLTPPLTASIHYMGRTREMTTPAASGDCNSCHTQDGTMSAPGRITLP